MQNAGCLKAFSDKDQKAFETAQAIGCPSFTLVAISNLDWNQTPGTVRLPSECRTMHWWCGRLFATFDQGDHPNSRERGWRSSSLAWNRRAFSGWAVCSVFHLPDGLVYPALCFPDMKEYIFSHKPKRQPDCMYFSLGDKERKTRNPVLRSVRQNTEEIQAFYQDKGIETVFQLSPGNL